jgi:hypothetical protein
MTLKAAWELAQTTEPWVFQDTVCSSVTMIYGRSNVGKSYLVASMILSLLVDGREFLGMEPTDRTKLWRPAILCTDPGSEEEYGKRIHPEVDGGEVDLYYVGRTVHDAEWSALAELLLLQGTNFVVLDNLMGATGDSNEAAHVSMVFDGLAKLTRRGVPVVVLHHESEKGKSAAGAAPMGASASVQKSRAWIQVRQTTRRQLRGGNTALVIQSNSLEQPLQLVAEPLAGPNYRVLNRGPWAPADSEDSKPAKEKRSSETYDERAEMALWVVEECQGKGLNATATALSAKFGKSQATCKEQLMRGALSQLLTRVGDGPAAVWSPK